MTQNAFLLWPELFRLLVAAVAGVLGFRLGLAAWSRSSRTGTATAISAVVMTSVIASVHYPPMRDAVGALVSWAGGEGALASLFLMIVIGVAWKAGRRFAGRPLLVVAAALSFIVLLIPAAAPLAWRWLGEPLYANYVDSAGLIQQKTGMTCGPAAGAMLLHRYGVHVSEGALAEGAGTNPLVGTDEYALARAMQYVASTRNLRATARRLSYESARRLACPFVAYVRRPGIGGHAILVTEAGEASVLTADPLSGSAEKIDRTTFEEEWTGIAIWVTPASRGD